MTIEHKMKYNYTVGVQNEQERIQMIAKDILIEYPRLGIIAEKIATMETPFGSAIDDYADFGDQENHINRLINIVIVTEGKEIFQAEYEKASKDLVDCFDSWKLNFTYANPEEQPVYMVMQSFYAHQKNHEIPLITVAQAITEVQRRKAEQNLKEEAQRMRYQFPELGEIADQVVYIDSKSGQFVRWTEGELSKLVLVIKLTENKPQYCDVFQKAVDMLNQKYKEWLDHYGNLQIAEQEKSILAEMMNRLNRHLNGEAVEIASYLDILLERDSSYGMYSRR